MLVELTVYYLFLFIVNGSLGLYVILKNHKSVLNIGVASIAMSTSIWCLGWAGIIHFQQPIWVYMTFIGGLSPVFFTIFCFIYPDHTPYRRFIALNAFNIPTLAVIGLLPFGGIITQIESYVPLLYADTLINKLIRLYWLAILMGGIVILIKKSMKYTGDQQKRLRYVLYASVIFASASILGNLIFPLLGIHYLTGLAPAVSIIWVGLLIYAFLKLQLLDVKIILKRVTSTGVTVALLVGIYIVIDRLTQPWPMGNTIALMTLYVVSGFFLLKFRDWLITAAKRTLINGYYDPQEAINTISIQLNKRTSRSEIIQTLGYWLDQYLEIESLNYIIANRDTSGAVIDYKLHGDSVNDGQVLPKDHRLIEICAAIDYPEDRLSPDVVVTLIELNMRYTKILFPLNSPDGLEGGLLIGPKSNELIYSQMDRQFLTTVLNMTKSLLYRLTPQEKIEKAFFANQQRLHDAEKQLLQTRRDQERLETYQNAQHELRNPLAIIKNYVKKIADDQLKQKINRQIDRSEYVLDSSLRLTIAKPEPTDVIRLNTCIHSAIEFMDIEGLSIRMDLIDQDQVLGIKDDIVIVFTNLIKNASIAMPDGGDVIISSEIVGTDLLVQVIDSGCGIPLSEQKKVWELYYSIDKTKGHGLGLNIVQKIMADHHGTVSFQSVQDQGTTFTLRFPRIVYE